jgi:MFS family permease
LLAALLILRFLGFGSMQLVSNNVIAQWFVRRRGMVMGISGQSLAVSLLLWPTLTETLIQTYTWRIAWIGLGLLVLVVAIPIAWLFFRDRPELYGQQPDGNGRLGAIYPDIASEENWTLNEALHTGVFWIFVVAFMLMSTIYAGIVFHQASLFDARGLSRTVAITSFQVMAVVSILGNLIMGQLLDKISARLLLVIVLAILAAAVWLIQTMQTPVAALLYAAMFGLTMGAFRVMDATIWAKYFGRRHLGSIRGATMVGTVGGTALGALPLGLSFDLTGGYSAALTVFMVLPLGISALMIFVRRPQRREESQ